MRPDLDVAPFITHRLPSPRHPDGDNRRAPRCGRRWRQNARRVDHDDRAGRRGEIALRRGPHNRLGFAYQVAFVRVLGRFPQQAPLEIDGEILRFAALQLGADAETIHAYASRQQTVSEHQQRIGEYLRLRAFDAAAGERLARFLEDEALRLERPPRCWRGRAPGSATSTFSRRPIRCCAAR